MTTGRRPTGLLRVLLRALAAMRGLAPASRRRDWYRQWRADVWHESQWVSREPGPRPQAATALAVKVAGAARHAIWLRFYVRRLEMISHDLRYGWRLMVRRPAFTVIAIAMLGLGIGTSVTIFSWLQTALQPIPGVADRDRLVMLQGTTRTRNDLSTSYPNLVDYRERRPASITDMAGQAFAPLNITIGRSPQRIYGLIVTGNYFDMLGVQPMLGRGFLPEEDRAPGQAPVIVFGEGFWRRQLGGDRSIVGKAVTVNGRPFTVVGIAAPGFRGAMPHLAADAFVPMMMQASVRSGDKLTNRFDGWLQPVVKLAPGVTRERAQADMQAVVRQVRADRAAEGEASVRLVEPWRSSDVTVAVTAVIAAQLGVALIVLVIACANVASLLLARAAGRQKETAVRLSLGAGRLRLLQQVLVESTLLAVGGGVVGVAVAYWSAGLMQGFVPPTPLPVNLAASLDGRALAFALGLTAVSVFVFGLVPALQGSATSVVASLKDSAASVTSSRSRTRLRSGIVVCQVALSVLLIVCAALFLRTLRHASAIDPGFSTRRALLATVDLLPAGYDRARGAVFLQTLLARLRELPGVEAATTVRRMPLGLTGVSDSSFEAVGYIPAPGEEMSTDFSNVGSGYLATMGIRLVEGRDIADGDVAGARDVVVINETLARRYFAGRRAVGGQLKFFGRTFHVVGIARDGKYGSIGEPPRSAIYVPVQQIYVPDAVLVLATSGDPLTVLPAVQAAVRQLDPNVPLFEVRTMAEHLEFATFVQRTAASVVTGLGVVALVLAAVGLYGVMAWSVALRTPEIGMRVALGASRRDIVRLILGQGARIAALGLVLGLGLAVAVTRMLRGLLVGVTPTDAVSYVLTIVVLALVAMGAAALPARRAARMDPLTALRHD
jgi:macrolide transport system ATP-binding/permease protein